MGRHTMGSQSPLWNPDLQYVPLVHHGEKQLFQSQLISENLKNQDLLDTEASILHCVNPREVNPIPGSPKESTEYLLNFNVTNVDMSESGVFYDPQRKVKLEMEEFKDLSGYLPNLQPTVLSSTSDELNTPVFDKDAFDFTMPTIKSSPYDYKFDNDLFANLSIPQNKDLINRLHQGSSFSNISNNVQQNNEITHINPPTVNSNGNYYSDCESPPYELLSHNNSVQSMTDLNPALCTPEDSNSSNNSVKPQLYLNLNLNPLVDTINTPDVINTVTELDNFNILDIVQAEEIGTVNVEDIFPSSTFKSKTQSRRRRRSSTSDDEYVPPAKSAKKYEGDSSDESDSDYEHRNTNKRGRTRKALSVDSNDSREGDVSRYRVIRDKNNEASRKSRMKRKLKELDLEKECDELKEKNIKLKAQVEELEKTVSSYRDNLFKIMLKK